MFDGAVARDYERHMDQWEEAARMDGTASDQRGAHGPRGADSIPANGARVKFAEARESLQDLVGDMLRVPGRFQRYFERAGRLECTSCAFYSDDPETTTCPNCNTWLVSPARAAAARRWREVI